jgi:hypothetical protein
MAAAKTTTPTTTPAAMPALLGPLDFAFGSPVVVTTTVFSAACVFWVAVVLVATELEDDSEKNPILFCVVPVRETHHKEGPPPICLLAYQSGHDAKDDLHLTSLVPLHGVSQDEFDTCALCGGFKSPHQQFVPSVNAITGLFNMMQISWQLPGDWYLNGPWS